MAGFGRLDTLVDANQSVATFVQINGENVYRNTSPAGIRPWRIYSITKSVVSVLFDIAVADQKLDYADPVSRWVPMWGQTDSEQVTIQHLLTMTSGRRWSHVLDDELISLVDDVREFSLTVGQEYEPGSVWRYDNIAAQVLEAVLTAAVGDIEKFAQERLFTPLGMASTTWSRDAHGHILTYAGITSTVDDVLKLGQLVADGGRAGDREIVPAELLAASTRGSTGLNAGYGRLWWTNTPGTVIDVDRAIGGKEASEARSGQLVASLPEDTVWALGWGSQILAVIPSRNLVALRFGRRPRYSGDLTIESFTSAVLEGAS